MAHVNSDACVSCGACEAECPVGAISQGADHYEINADACVDCGACAAQCPLAFARYLDEQNIPIWVRHVIVPGITFYQEYLEQLGTFLGTLNNVKALDILPYHSMGKAKYDNLHMDYPLKDTPEPSKEDAEAAKRVVLAAYKHEKQRLNKLSEEL